MSRFGGVPVVEETLPTESRFSQPEAPVEEREERQIAPGIWSKRSLGEIISGTAETAATIGSAIVAEPVSGLAGIAGAVLPGEAGQGAEWVEGVQDAMTYQPRGEAGQEYLGDVGSFLEPVGEALTDAETGMGETVLELTGSPELATAAHTVPTAALEALGLGILKKSSKAADAAVDAQERVRVTPNMDSADIADEMTMPEEMSYEQITEKLRLDDKKAVAEQVLPDEEIFRAAEELGVELNPGHYSTNEAFIRVEQAIKSQPQSKLAAREAEAITQLGKRADELIKETGGDIDRSILDDAVGGEMRGTIDQLGDSAEKLYKRVNDKIPPATKVTARGSRAYLETRLNELGGDVSGLTAPERALYQVFQSDKPPTYARLDQLRRDVGAGYKRQGVFKDEVSGNLDGVYKALIRDQQGVADAFGVGNQFKAGRKMVQTRKALENNAIKLLGKELNKSILPKLTQAATGLTKGDTKQFQNLMRALPEGQRTRAAATLLNDLFVMGQRGRGGSIGQGFARSYDALDRNPGAKAELFKYLPESTRTRFEAIGKVSQGIYRAKALENTSRTARDILEALQTGGMASRMLDKTTDTVLGRMTFMPGPTRWLAAGAKAAKTMGKELGDKAKAAEKLMASREFERAINLAMENRVREADIMLRRSGLWKAWRKTVGEGTQRQLNSIGPIAWLTQQDDPARQERAGNQPMQPEALPGVP
ncbi:MAG: hypothetical protein ACR2PR_13090 [Pseudohongiellaceae bacterium]